MSPQRSPGVSATRPDGARFLAASNTVLPRGQRLFSAAIAWAGLVGCLSLAFRVEPHVWMVGLGVLGLARLRARRGRRERAAASKGSRALPFFMNAF